MTQYDKNVDKAILKELYPEPSRLFTNKTSFNELYRGICRSYKKISRTTFSFHLKRMIDEDKLIDREDDLVRGTIVNYFLTELGKQKYRFYFSLTPTNQQINEENLEKIYQLLFLFANANIYKALYSEKEFEDFLSKIPISKDQLIVDSIKVEKEPENTTSSSSHQNIQPPYYIIWEDDDIEENNLILKRTHTKFKPVKSEILVSKQEIEYVLHKHKAPSFEDGQNDNRQGIERRCSYRYHIPGVSLSDFMHHTPIKYIGFTKEEVKKVFDFLERNRTIKPINDHLGEKRYSMYPAHKSLRDLLVEYAGAQVMATVKLQLIWFNFRRLTREEWKWYVFLHGKERAVEYSTFAYKNRNSIRRSKSKTDIIRTKEIIEEYDSEISDTLESLEKEYADTIQKYKFPLRGVLEMVYPEFIRRATF
jgi:DNA-binding HxlR family transcriptional regulator